MILQLIVVKCQSFTFILIAINYILLLYRCTNKFWTKTFNEA